MRARACVCACARVRVIHILLCTSCEPTLDDETEDWQIHKQVRKSTIASDQSEHAAHRKCITDQHLRVLHDKTLRNAVHGLFVYCPATQTCTKSLGIAKDTLDRACENKKHSQAKTLLMSMYRNCTALLNEKRLMLWQIFYMPWWYQCCVFAPTLKAIPLDKTKQNKTKKMHESAVTSMSWIRHWGSNGMLRLVKNCTARRQRKVCIEKKRNRLGESQGARHWRERGRERERERGGGGEGGSHNTMDKLWKRLYKKEDYIDRLDRSCSLPQWCWWRLPAQTERRHC